MTTESRFDWLKDLLYNAVLTAVLVVAVVVFPVIRAINRRLR